MPVGAISINSARTLRRAKVVLQPVWRQTELQFLRAVWKQFKSSKTGDARTRRPFRYHREQRVTLVRSCPGEAAITPVSRMAVHGSASSGFVKRDQFSGARRVAKGYFSARRACKEW